MTVLSFPWRRRPKPPTPPASISPGDPGYHDRDVCIAERHVDCAVGDAYERGYSSGKRSGERETINRARQTLLGKSVHLPDCECPSCELVDIAREIVRLEGLDDPYPTDAVFLTQRGRAVVADIRGADVPIEYAGPADERFGGFDEYVDATTPYVPEPDDAYYDAIAEAQADDYR